MSNAGIRMLYIDLFCGAGGTSTGVEATLRRIYAGLVKFVAGGKDAFLVKWNSMNRHGVYHAPGIDEPCPVVATQNRLGVARVHFLSKQFGGEPSGKNISIDGPAGSVTTRDHHAFITAYYGNGGNHSIDEPSPTLTTKDRLAFIDMQYGHGSPVGIDIPSPVVTTNPKQNLVVCKRHYLMNPQYSSAGGSIDKPCFTLIARMDKMPPYLVEASNCQDFPDFVRKDEGGIMYEIYDSDSEAMVDIKTFMAVYGITDIKMRMLNEVELKLIMGFPREYILVGTQAERKKYIGNAVVTVIPKVWAEAMAIANDSMIRRTI